VIVKTLSVKCLFLKPAGVSYYDREGQQQTHEIRGYSACTWQHEYDYLAERAAPVIVIDKRPPLAPKVREGRYQLQSPVRPKTTQPLYYNLHFQPHSHF